MYPQIGNNPTISHTMEHNSIKRNMIHATTWMNLKTCQVKESRHKRPHITYIIHLYEMSRKGKFLETERSAVVAGGRSGSGKLQMDTGNIFGVIKVF